MTWAQHLKRVVKIDTETCNRCGGGVQIIASSEDPAVIKRIVGHIEHRAQSLTIVPGAPLGHRANEFVLSSGEPEINPTIHTNGSICRYITDFGAILSAM